MDETIRHCPTNTRGLTNLYCDMYMAFSGKITSMIMRYMYGGKGVHRGTLGADDILVRHGEQIALIYSQLHVKLTEGRN